MPIVNLTARRVQALKPPIQGRLDYWDQNQEKFSLRISASGRKTWTVCYRFHGRKRRLRLGEYPALSLADARQMARDAIRDVSHGIDPVAANIKLRQAGTFDELATEYMERHAKREKRSWRSDKWMIDRHLLPRWRHVRRKTSPEQTCEQWSKASQIPAPPCSPIGSVPL